MPEPIVECVPNFSEGRRLEVIDDILRSMQAVPGVFILDRHSDPDHNRTVITMAGNPKSMEEAALAAIACASRRIDLSRHSGVHPRIGATDVVPFVPLQGSSRAECIPLARRVGQRAGEELGIPVYLYEDAALLPARRNLAAVRLGQYEGLCNAIRDDPLRKPDYGPAFLGPAGATAIGVRGPLIAFNVFLETERVDTARAVARAIRESSGGLPHLKALGLLVRNRGQVSMNLTDYTQTSIQQAYEAVQHETKRQGVRIAWSEIVGLVPEAAMRGVDPVYLKIENFSPDIILEKRMAKAGMRYSATDAPQPDRTV